MTKKLKQILKKEFLYYSVIFLILAFIMHSDLLSDPFSRLEIMQEKENYSHPFFYSFIVYSVILVLRIIINFVSKIFEKKSN